MPVSRDRGAGLSSLAQISSEAGSRETAEPTLDTRTGAPRHPSNKAVRPSAENSRLPLRSKILGSPAGSGSRAPSDTRKRNAGW